MKKFLGYALWAITLYGGYLLPHKDHQTQAIVPLVAAAIITAIPSLIKIGKGIFDTKAGKKMARGNIRPFLDQSGQYEDLLQFYEKQAQYGLDANSMAWQLDQSNRGLTRTMNTMLQAGGNPNTAAGTYGSYADNIARIATVDSEKRWEKVNASANAMRELFGERQTEFLYNKDAPYKDIAQLASAKQQLGTQAAYGGMSELASNMLGLFTSYYKPKEPPQVPPDVPNTLAAKSLTDAFFKSDALTNTINAGGNLAGDTLKAGVAGNVVTNTALNTGANFSNMQKMLNDAIQKQMQQGGQGQPVGGRIPEWPETGVGYR